ncbi:MAG: hypothetical protein RQ741_11260 [Wenzhouxiangellaceae bacterium]|nr:hypothetical protein [Wenzhouxiangellaceae bacterium]
MKTRVLFISALVLAGLAMAWLVGGGDALDVRAQAGPSTESQIIAERAVDFPTDI